MTKMNIYTVAKEIGSAWNDDYEAFDDVSGLGEDITYFTSPADALTHFSDLIGTTRDGQVISIYKDVFDVENLPEQDFALSAKDFDKIYGECKQTETTSVLQEFYIHDQCPYSNDLLAALEEHLREMSEYYNMRVICEKARVNYSTFRGFKNNKQPFSKEKCVKLLTAMSAISCKAWNDTLGKAVTKLEQM